ncbi:MAG: DUF3373 family protein [Bacteriovorax sp.]|nr:DUF3373 family protein [Bacteriovorax sp.]
MYKLFFTFSLTALILVKAHASNIENQQADIQKLDERITDIELRAMNNKINFGLDLKIESAMLNDKSQISTKSPTTHSGYVGAILFRINIDSNVSENLNVYASAESLSFFNENLFNGPATINNREKQVKGEKLSLSKAYFDWKFYKNWLTFSAGRLPTTQGPPAHIKDGVGREGTYPLTGYSVPLDGYALTAKISTPLELKDKLSLRLIYKPGGSANSTYPFRGVPLGDINHPRSMATNHQLFSGMLEFEQKNNTNGIWENMLAILQYGYYRFSSAPAFETTGLLGDTDIEKYRVYYDNDRLIDAKILSPYLELSKIFSTHFDIYSTFAFSKTKNYAHARATKLTSISGAPAGTDFDLGAFIHPGEQTGTRILAGTRYEFPDHYFLGAEYMKATEKAVPTVFYADSLVSPNYYNGHSFELYALKSLYNDDFIIRLGFIHLNVNADLSNSLFLQNTVEKINIAILSLNIRI